MNSLQSHPLKLVSKTQLLKRWPRIQPRIQNFGAQGVAVKPQASQLWHLLHCLHQSISTVRAKCVVVLSRNRIVTESRTGNARKYHLTSFYCKPNFHDFKGNKTLKLCLSDFQMKQTGATSCYGPGATPEDQDDQPAAAQLVGHRGRPTGCCPNLRLSTRPWGRQCCHGHLV